MPSMFSSHTVVTGGNYHLVNNDSKGAWDRLVDAASPAAFHNSSDRRDPPKCHHNTRVVVLKKVMDWIHGLEPATQHAVIVWLYGPAGAGKSAIAQSIAELCCEEGNLIASYFFSRFDSTRNHPRSLIATIAYQASLCIPNIRERIKAAIDHDPLIFDRSLTVQMSALVIQPLQDYISPNTPAPARVIIIDGLDECEDRQSQVEILATISKALQHHLPFIFLIASRPEHDIRTAFSSGYLKDVTTSVPLDNEHRPSDDIRLFLQDSFTEIKKIHPFRADIPDTWPDDNILESLVKKSSSRGRIHVMASPSHEKSYPLAGQFIYASTVIKFIKSSRHRPPQRLEIVLGLHPAQRDMPFAELDALYMHIFSSVEDPEAVLQISAYKFLTSPVMHWYEGLDLDLLSLAPGNVVQLFCDLTSLVSITVRGQRAVLDIFHASLEDFLLDQSRSQQFWINSKIRHAKFAHRYIHCLKGESANAESTLAAQVKSIIDRPSSHVDDQAPYILIRHFENATANPDLSEDLRQVCIWSILFKTHKVRFFPDILASIEKVGFENWVDLHSHQLHLFDQSAQETIDKMYSWPYLTAFIAVFDLAIEKWSDGGRVVFRLRKNHRNLDKRSFACYMNVLLQYRHFMGKFLTNPTRCGIYGLTGKRYATAAEYFLGYICDHMDHIMQSSYALHQWYYRRRRTAFSPRRRSTTPIRFPAKKIKQRTLMKWEQHRPYLLPRSCSVAFRLALRFLSCVLCQADRSDGLACQRKFWLFTLGIQGMRGGKFLDIWRG
ncbi:hypothetical protein CVT25_010271 [Psilocybe cyanescens]|uniref:Nephrocystin 3-like N-terminal domain-containing protein n=1 Tax=Psilocybe cyanescens TaxID=93625 RepID=A0A409X2S1_PSICY|nr:hypothetical protein CVT25_010271 [Psilocybe cyanescens]